MSAVHLVMLALSGILSSLALGYVALADWRARRSVIARAPVRTFAPPVSILKPLCGDEPRLYDNLRSFFLLDYPDYELIFGVRDRLDPALTIVDRLRTEFPDREVNVVADSRMHGMNGKSSNLINILRAASHHVLVIADSDIRVPANYLARVVAPLADRAVGAVTCPYSAFAAEPTFAARLACMQINDWFLPSILVARILQRVDFCMGSTIAVRREVLDSIGGFWALRNVLADDYVLGRALVDRGYRIVLSDCHVKTVVAETALSDVLRHELRWARTIRTLRPAGFAGMFLTNTIPVCVLAGVTIFFEGDGIAPAIAMGAAGVIARLVLHRKVRRTFDVADVSAWLLPVRDLMSLAVWGASFFSREVTWRGRTLLVDNQGMLLSETDR